MNSNIKLSKLTKRIYIYALSALMVTSNVNVTSVRAENETSPENSNTAEPSSKDYSELIQSSEVTYNDDKSVATVTISVNTEDDVILDFSNNETVSGYMESNFSEVNQSEDGKSYTFSIVKNGTYTFNAAVLNSGDDVTSDEAIGSKTITFNIDELTETEDNTNQYEADEAVAVILKPTIENVHVAYFAWHSESDTTGTINFTDIDDNATSVTVNDFKDSSTPGYILCFVTPKNNHLFTGLGADGAGQAWLVGNDGDDFSIDNYYVIDKTTKNKSGIYNYPGLENVILAARKKGYLACFGWSRSAGTNEEDLKFELTATEPTMTVKLTLVKSDKPDGSVTNLLPGNKLYFQVVATPSTVKNSTVQKVTLTSVHGETVDEELTKQSDGTYTNGTDYIEYVITEDDWLKGRVTFTVGASVDYTCSFNISSGTVSTTSTVTESTNTEAAPNPKYNKNVSLAKYAFVSADGSTLPDSVTSLLPSVESVGLNATVTPTSLDTTKVTVDNGYWEFTGWNPESKTTSSTPEIFTFTGTWKYRQSINPDEEGYGNVTIDTPSDVTYNGSSQQQEPVVKDKNGNTLTKGTDYELSYSNDTTNAGDVTVTVTGIGNYSGTVTTTYKINKRNVTLTSETASKPYDGTALTKPNVTTDGDGFVAGEVSDLKAIGSVTTVSEGTVTNTITYTKGTNYKDSNYNITKNEGRLSITSKTLDPDTEGSTITVNDATNSVYDGNEHKYVPEVKAGNTTLTTDDYDVTYSTTDFTNATGTITVTITGKGNYTGEFTRTYEITKRPISFAGNSATRTYNGQDQTVSGSTITSTDENTGLVNGHTADVTATATRKDIGTTEGTITVNSITNNGVDVTNNYNISATPGSITISKQSVNPSDTGSYDGITVRAPSDVKYNGSSQQQKPTVTDKNGTTLTEGTDYELSYSNDTTNAGTVTVTITGTGNYSGVVTTTYQITKRQVTINASNASKVYGETDPEFTYTFAEDSDSIIGTDLGTISVSRTKTGETVGTYTDDLTVSYTANNNYNVITNTANFTISTQSIKPEDDAYSGVQIDNPTNYIYDGSTRKWSPTVKATDATDAPTLTEGVDYTVTYTRGNTETTDFTNFGKITVTITGIGNYSGTVTKQYDIIQRKVTINATEASKVYGAANPEFGYTVTSGSIIGTDLGTITVSRTSTDESAKTYTNDLTVSYTPNNNYIVETHPANFTITPQSINPKKDDGSADPSYINVSVSDPTDATYDGNEHKFVPEVKAGNTTLVKDTDYTVTYSTTDFTNVKGEITVTITGKDNYSGTITKKYKINPKPVTITVEDKSKVYEQEDPEFTATQTGLVKDDDLGTITAYRTNKDETAGTYRDVLDVTYTSNTNYTVTVEKGNFVILPQSISPKDDEGKDDPTYLGVKVNDPKDVIYDGKEHKFVPEVTKPDGTKLEEGKDYTVTYTVKDPTTGEQVEIDDFTNVNGEITVTITGTGNYSGTITKTYEIKQREIEFVGNSATKIYNGKEQAVDGWTVKLTDETHGLVSGHTATLAAGASRKDEGTSTGRITAAGEVVIMNGKEDVTKNYKITTTPGSITIKCSGWDDGGPFTTDTCGNVFDRWGNKIYEATSCNVGGYNLVRTSVED